MPRQRQPQKFDRDPCTLDRQRLDKWLWFSRVVKSRTQASRLIEAGYVRVNAQRCVNSARFVAPYDILTIALERQVRVLRIVAMGERRGPFEEARLLFQDLEPGLASPVLALQA